MVTLAVKRTNRSITRIDNMIGHINSCSNSKLGLPSAKIQLTLRALPTDGANGSNNNNNDVTWKMHS